MRLTAVAFLAALLLSGCAGIRSEKKEQLIDRPGIDVVGAPADRQEIVIKDSKSLERFCKGPSPDVAMTASSGISLGLTAGVLPAGEKVGDGSSRGALSLGGRSPAVLLARELMYRACELVINTRADPKTAIQIYKMTMDSIERIAALQTGNGTVAKNAAPPPASADLPAGMFSTAPSSAAASGSSSSDDGWSDGSSDSSSGSPSGSSSSSTNGW
jgi:hypothetical protein